MSEKNVHATCHRCGICCRKGGPCLHSEDMPLLRAGAFGLQDLLTLRVGEKVREPAGSLVLLAEERVKIAGRDHTRIPADWTCHFFDETGCRLYAQRPVQCRLLFCEDSEPLKAQYNVDCASRKEVLSAVSCPAFWWELVQAHEEACSVNLLVHYATEMRKNEKAGAALWERVRYDDAFRDLCREKADIPAEYLPFLLGRPLRECFVPFLHEQKTLEDRKDVCTLGTR